MSQSKIVIIGAGPAGLAVAGRLRKNERNFEIIERSGHVGWSWHCHYDRLHLHTVKQLSNLPHLPFPEDYPLYVPKDKLVQYFEQYANHFNIEPIFNTEVQKIVKSGDQWQLEYNNGTTQLADQVIIATGVNRDPKVPQWKNQENFNGEITHTKLYKNPNPYLGKKVLVVGFGNTGAEIALDLAEAGIETFVSVRNPVAIVPRDVFGRPVQLTAKKLAKIPFGIGDWLGAQIRKVVIGNLSKYGLPMSKVAPVVQLRETGKTPVVDIGTADLIKKGKIKVLPDIDHFYDQGIKFSDGRSEDFDVVLLATGYSAGIEGLIPDASSILDRYQVPSKPIGTGVHEGLYFVGFDNYKLGGILGTIFTDSKTVVDHIVENH